MYNFPGGQYGRPPGYGAYPGAQGAPPGMAPPPGMGPPPGAMPAPGVTPPPGIQQSQSPLPARPGNLPPNFAPPAGMPNINFNAPVIRLGTTGPSAKGDDRKGGNEPSSAGGRRPGLGNDYRGSDSRNQQRESMMSLQPPTREEIARTIFVSNITEGVGGDEGLERILRCAGSLRRWTRATDSDNKTCKFGFAEFEDAESLETAAAIFQDGIEVPAKKQEPGKGDDEEIEMSRLLVMVDEASMKYAEEWKGKRDEDEAASQFRIDTAKEALASVLASLKRPREAPTQDADGDITMSSSETKVDGATGEVVTIPLTVEDELSDIPAEMRETVAAEIAAFRDRSVRRDMERLAREEEIEKAERQKSSGQRYNRLASPPPSAPSGPAGGANGIPLGPSKRGVEGAPSGPKAFQGAQIPKDYQNGVTFVGGGGISARDFQTCPYINRSDEEDSASDEELEKRRRKKKQDEEDKAFQEHERRWLNREKSRAAAIEREQARDKEEEAAHEAEVEAMGKRLADWDDDNEASRRTEEYYADRPLWLRNRTAFRAREAAADDKDRNAEEREKQKEKEQNQQARDMADSFLSQTAKDLADRNTPTTPREPQRFKMSLGAAASQRAQQAAPRRTAAEVENMLEDEEDAAAANAAPRKLIPIKFDTTDVATMSEEERQQAAQQLAREIPVDREGLWNWDVKWDHLLDEVVSEQLQPFVEKKIVELLGVQEQTLVDVVLEHIRKKGKPQVLVDELSMALDEEAEDLVRKIYRMIIFFTESEKRGLSAIEVGFQGFAQSFLWI
ncbi:putative rna-binding protein rbm25 protein [Neofusicoccum parvum UCRNP2]|uniref:Putative rna-binding protein rbm25 protein n=1 Tax=Botryosphaeria parva (strain UCR-NP2) TaxID=1287680 RepID=R1GN22_BOTPV|nr:putative rna-binding protein rbm25 protein [Neofusicoccum parvum UCRNP2]